MTRILTLLVATSVAAGALTLPASAEMAAPQQSTTEKVKSMTKAQWAKLQAEWRKDKAKFTACNAKSKEAKLKGRKRWSAIYDCMMQ
jgi:hypothetical protein